MGKEVFWNGNRAGYLNMTSGLPYITLFLLDGMGTECSGQLSKAPGWLKEAISKNF